MKAKTFEEFGSKKLTKQELMRIFEEQIEMKNEEIQKLKDDGEAYRAEVVELRKKLKAVQDNCKECVKRLKKKREGA